ncbi:hypothetical protein [Burkholderia sp. Ax-1719]|uniref:hypothetical protein n=1 Tax=Burkholderia sp. Ax-1719 TaxID=2608334 RepID=UPI001423BD7D|nr:hypothetical protein [Burkholderia sp. Ax-1719]NIE68129.1 hypothetical protein [Burkholderia sp. Ax-1719]
MHDSTRSENGTLPTDARTVALVRGATHTLELRRGAAIVAVEGELLVRYRDAALASLGQLAPEQRLHLQEGEQYVARERNCYAVSAMQTPGARFLLLKPQRSTRSVWITLTKRLSRAFAWLRAHPQQSDAA